MPKSSTTWSAETNPRHKVSTAKLGSGKGYLREMKNGKLQCSLGGEWKEPDKFPPDKRRTYGRGSACRFHRNLRVANARLPRHYHMYN